MQTHDLEIPRGARFRAHGWVAVGEDGAPLRSTAGVTVVAKVRRYAGDTHVLHTFMCSAVALVLPGQYDDAPVVVAQIDEMSPAQTAELTFDVGVYDVLVNDDLQVRGRVDAPLVVSRP